MEKPAGSDTGLRLPIPTVHTMPADSDRDSCPSLAQVTPVKEFPNHRLLGSMALHHLEHSQLGVADARQLGAASGTWSGLNPARHESFSPNTASCGSRQHYQTEPRRVHVSPDLKQTSMEQVTVHTACQGVVHSHRQLGHSLTTVSAPF